MKPVTNDFGEKFYPALAPHDFLKEPSGKIYGKRFGEDPFKDDSLYILCGSDSGLLINYITSKIHTNNTKYIFIEDEDAFAAISSLLPELITAHDSVIICSPDKFKVTAHEFGLEEHYYKNTLYLVPAECALDPGNPRYANLANEAMKQINATVLDLGVRLKNLPFLLEILKNVPENQVPIKVLENCLENRAAVLLGGGPSLDDILPWIRKHRRNLTIFAVSRISNKLLEEGLTPDLVFTIDPQYLSFVVSREMLRLPPTTILVNNSHANASLVGQWQGRSVYWGPRFPWSDYDLPATGSTVTHLAFWTALYCGCKEIIFGGVDLCFSAKGYTHAKGSEEHKAGPNLSRGLIEVETNEGGFAETDLQMAKGREEMETLAHLAGSLGIRVLNPAPGAARMAGVEHVALDEIVVRSADQTAADQLREVVPFRTLEDRQTSYRAALSELGNTRSRLKRIRRRAGETLRLNTRLPELQGSSLERAKRKIDRFETWMRTENAGLRRTFLHMFTPQWMTLLQESPEHGSVAEVKNKGEKVLKLYLDSAKKLIELIDPVEHRLGSRLEEEVDAPDLSTLLDQWERDQQPGRFLVFSSRNPGAAKTARRDASTRDRIGAIEAEFTRMMTAPFEELVLIAEEFLPDAEMKKALVKTTACFTRRDAHGLTRVDESLSKWSHRDTGALRALIAGYRAELAEDPERARAHYEHAASSENPAIEQESRKRIVALALTTRDFETAIGHLDRLRRLSDEWLPEYANVLRLADQPLRAVDAYIEHVGAHPKDTGALLKLGELQLEMGAREAARLASLHVLANDPANQDARTLLSRTLGEEGTPGP